MAQVQPTPGAEGAGPSPAAVAALLGEHAELEARLADPAVHADPSLAHRLGRRYAELTGVVEANEALLTARSDVAAARELGAHDQSFRDELPSLESVARLAAERLRRVLLPRDPDDDRDTLIEVLAGEGGEESALFAADLLRMYTRYAERVGWRTRVLTSTVSDLGGVKDATLQVSGKPGGDQGVWAWLKFEGGVHRVQRVPVTESAGRIHTSAVGVVVTPDVGDDVDEVQVAAGDLRIDVYRSSGPGGQSVNTTDSAVRITHLPTGVVASCQNEKSQLQNREQAMRILLSRLRAKAREEADAVAQQARRSQVRTVDRSQRIRTYNYGENRITDHRTGYKAYNLDQVLDGDLGPVLQSCVDADEAERLAEAGSQ